MKTFTVVVTKTWTLSVKAQDAQYAIWDAERKVADAVNGRLLDYWILSRLRCTSEGDPVGIVSEGDDDGDET